MEAYRRYLDGDESAFAELVEAYYRNLVFFVNRYVHDPDAAEDVAIDTLTELVVHPKRYNFKTPLKTYLFSIARHKAMHYAAQQSRLSPLPEQEMPAQEKSLEDAMIADQRKQALNDAVRQLPKEQQIVIHLLYFEDLSGDDAAKVMGKSRKQIYNLTYRAKTALRSILEQKGEL